MKAQNNSVMLTELEDEGDTQKNQTALSEHIESAMDEGQAKEKSQGKKSGRTKTLWLRVR